MVAPKPMTDVPVQMSVTTIPFLLEQMTDFLEGEYLKEQVESINEIAKYITMLKRVGPGLGEHQFDREVLLELKY